jgi:copper transport protein
MRRLAPAAAALLVAVAASPQAASAHAYPLSSTPSFGQQLARAPDEIRILFSDTIRPASGNAAVSNATGRSILSGPAHVDPRNQRELVLPLATGLPHGNYTARWRVISNDGHIEEGLLEFRVGAGAVPTRPALRLLGTGTGTANLIGRVLFVLGVVVSLGMSVFALVVWTPVVRRLGPRGEAGQALLAREARTTAIVLFCSFAAAQLGSVLAILHATTGTRYGRMHELAIVFAGVGEAATASGRTPFRVLTALSAVGLATTPSLSGHALDPGEVQPLSFGADLLHVWAAGLWIGGLLALVLSVRLLARGGVAEARALTASLARRFSSLALLAVAVVALTGLGRVLVELTSVPQLWSLSYGRAILVKTGLLAAVLVVARVSSRLLPSLDRPGTRSRLSLAAAAELVLLAGVIVAVGVLTNLRPGRSYRGQAPARGALPIAPQPSALGQSHPRRDSDSASWADDAGAERIGLGLSDQPRARPLLPGGESPDPHP